MVLVSTPTRQQPINQQKTIVLVENDSTNVLMLDLLLQTEHFYQTICFTSGEEVLAQSSVLKAMQPSLFVLDYRLPQMTGMELYEHLHTTEGFEQTPVILLTAYSFGKAERQRIAQQHLSVFYKPFDVNDFLRKIHQVIE